MSDQVNKEQTRAAKQENITELTDEQLDEASGGEICAIDNVPMATLLHPGDRTDEDLVTPHSTDEASAPAGKVYLRNSNTTG